MAVIETAEIAIKLHRLEPDDIATERVPLSTLTREMYDLVIVGHGRDRFNFLMKRPKSGLPPLIKLGDHILRYVEADKSHPDCVVHQYAIVPLEVVEVPDTTLITYPGRSGPSRTLTDWKAYEEPQQQPKRTLGARLDRLARGYY